MQESLNLQGNDLVNLQTIYTVGAVLGQLPFAYLFTKYPVSYLIPGMDLLWGVFTLLQYRATSYEEMMAYRFLVGWFEVYPNPNPTLILFPLNNRPFPGRLLPRNALHLRYVRPTNTTLPSTSNISRIMVPKPRNRPPGRLLLPRPNPRHANSQLHPSGSIRPTGRSKRPRRLALDVHHLRSNHHPRRDPRIHSPPRDARQTEPNRAQQNGHPTRPNPATESRTRGPRIKRLMEDLCACTTELEALGAAVRGHFLLERVRANHHGWVSSLVEESESVLD